MVIYAESLDNLGTGVAFESIKVRFDYLEDTKNINLEGCSQENFETGLGDQRGWHLARMHNNGQSKEHLEGIPQGADSISGVDQILIKSSHF